MLEILQKIGLTAVTSAVSITVLFLMTKLIGNRQMSQMSMFDYITGITIGSVAAELATELEEPVKPLTALIIYGLAAFGIALFTSKSIHVRKVVTGKPLVLLDNGIFYRDNLKKSRLDLNEFLTFARMGGFFDLSQVQTAVLEHNGVVSFLPKEPYRPATPSDMDLKPKQSHVQMPFVMDGKLLPKNIAEANKEETWVRRELMRQGYRDESEAFLALWDGETKLIVFPMEDRKLPS